MNQGKLKVVKQEMARVNIDILGISTLKWTGMGEFNSDDHDGYSISSKGFLPAVVDTNYSIYLIFFFNLLCFNLYFISQL